MITLLDTPNRYGEYPHGCLEDDLNVTPQGFHPSSIKFNYIYLVSNSGNCSTLLTPDDQCRAYPKKRWYGAHVDLLRAIGSRGMML